MLGGRSKQSGLTLVELMIALAISGVVVAAFISSFVLIIKGGRSSVDFGRLNAQLSHVVSAISFDVRRAGYWGNATGSTSNPFMVSGSTDIQINGANNCILLTYDRNGNGALPAINPAIDDERYGYRLMNNAIQYRPAGASFSCTAGATVWTNLTDASIVTITAFNVSLSTESVDIDGAGAGTAMMIVRRVNISISGQLVADSSITKTLTKEVKVYNDKFVP